MKWERERERGGNGWRREEEGGRGGCREGKGRERKRKDAIPPKSIKQMRYWVWPHLQ